MLYIVLFIVSFGISVLAVPVLKRIAFRYKVMIDTPDERKIHVGTVPRNGGIGIALASLIAIAIGFTMKQGIQGIHSVESRHLAGIVLGSILMLSLGILDDIKGLNATKKFSVQTMAACILILFGVRIRAINILFWHSNNLPLSVSVFVTIFWVLAVTNAINLIDGLDGLAGGVVVIAAAALCFYAVTNGNMLVVIITVSLIGGCLGFLTHNYPPASIFMGDSGTMFLGFVLASVSIQCLYKSSIASILTPITILALPLTDTSFAIVRRLWNHRSPFYADRGHIHHRLLDLGWSQRLSILVLYSLCALLTALTLIANTVNEEISDIITAATGITLVLVFFFACQYESRRNGKRKGDLPELHSINTEGTHDEFEKAMQEYKTQVRQLRGSK